MKLSTSSSLLLATLAISSSSSTLAVPVGDGPSSDTVPESVNAHHDCEGQPAEMDMTVHDRRADPLCGLLQPVVSSLVPNNLPLLPVILQAVYKLLDCPTTVARAEMVHDDNQLSVLDYDPTDGNDHVHNSLGTSTGESATQHAAPLGALSASPNTPVDPLALRDVPIPPPAPVATALGSLPSPPLAAVPLQASGVSLPVNATDLPAGAVPPALPASSPPLNPLNGVPLSPLNGVPAPAVVMHGRGHEMDECE